MPSPQITLQYANESVPLTHGRVDHILDNIHLHETAGISPHRILNHIRDHEVAEPQCPCCKLEGRLLTAQGRKNLQYVPPRNVTGGTTTVRRMRPGLSGAQIRELDRRAALRAERTTYPEPVKSVNIRVEDLI